MNEDMKYFAEELEEFLRKGHRMLNKMQQSMGQRGGLHYPMQGAQNGQMNNGGGSMGERNWFGMGGYDPRLM